ncbi:MAG: hypothetical protein IT372_36995 [Polyangiaceae bacterium]|nr:hypothetical protein [Polyangiaceae bacterium]
MTSARAAAAAVAVLSSAACPSWSAEPAAAALEGEAAAPARRELSSQVLGLIFDLMKMVEAQQSLGWKIDRYEIEELLPHALLSVCASTAEAHGAALAELDARIAELGGPADEAFRRSGGDLGAIGELLKVTRVRMLLDEAMLRAAEECPFWIQPSPDFHGLQTDEGRFTLSVEGGGLLVIQRANGKVYPGGGGSGRLLVGRGLSTSWTLLGGGEFGGSALFQQSASETHFPIGFVLAAPVVLRRNDLTWHYDFEVAPLLHFTQSDSRLSAGMRGGVLLGISALRIRSIMPWAGVGLAFEYFIGNSYRPALWNLKSGARVGFDWDF